MDMMTRKIKEYHFEGEDHAKQLSLTARLKR